MDLRFVRKMDAYNSRLYDSLEERKRAVKNWQRLRILLVLLSLTGGIKKRHTIRKSTTHLKFEVEDSKQNKGCLASFAPYIINPQSLLKVVWDLIMNSLYFICYLFDPLIFATRYEPLLEVSQNKL